MLIIDEATCLYHCCGIMCSWVRVFEGPENVFAMVARVLGKSEFKSLGNLCIRHIYILPKMVGEFLGIYKYVSVLLSVLYSFDGDEYCI